MPAMAERRRRMALTLPLTWQRRLLYLRAHGRLPSCRRPRTFTEKVNWRILNDRRASIALACDKLAAKALAERCPLVRVPATYWSGTDLAELAAADLPARWVLKPNNTSGAVFFGRGSAGESLSTLEPLVEDWRRSWPFDERGEWGYQQARRRLLAEEHIGGDVPTDYKFFVFHGEPRFIQVDSDRFNGHQLCFYSTDWVKLAAHLPYPHRVELDRPAHLDEMLEVARQLAKDMDFMRVDLYDAADEVWFGELTPYPSSGLLKISPSSFDRAWGELWTLPPLSEVSEGAEATVPT